MARKKDNCFYNKRRSSKWREKSLTTKETPTSTDLCKDPVTIEQETRGQAISAAWRAERAIRLTASNFGTVLGLRKVSSTQNCVNTLRYGTFCSKNMQYGKENESKALEAFTELYVKDVDACGLFVDRPTQHPYLAASPDGLVRCENALVEVKCLSAAARENCASIEDAIDAGKVKNCKIGSDGTVELRPKSHWFSQIQGQLNITGRLTCYLILYTPAWIHVIIVKKDEKYWTEEMVPKLEKFYNGALLPEIVEPMLRKRGLPSDIRVLYSLPGLHSTWEPEENILDVRLIDVFEHSQRGECKRGPKRKEQKEKERLAKERERERAAEAEAEAEEEEDEDEDEEETEAVDEDSKKELSREKPAADDACSDSSDDAPLSGPTSKDSTPVDPEKTREQGTKRKAEVLSKESGKIGVTITTSPGGSPPPTKTPKFKELSPLPVTGSKSEKPPIQQVKPLEKTPVVPKTGTGKSGEREKGTIRRPSVAAEKDEHEGKRVGSPPFKVASPPPVGAPATPRADDHKKAITPVSTSASLPLTGGSLSPPVARGEEAPRQKKPQQPQETHTTLSLRDSEDKLNNNRVVERVRALTPHSADYWRLRSPVADQVFITDVTVNLQTVTIRECKTEKGFFKEREQKSHVK